MEYGINLNGDISPEQILKRAKIAEYTGFKYLWIGENIHFRHPYVLIPYIAEHTKIKIGTGIISPLINKCDEILRFFKMLIDEYGNRFIAGIAPGDLPTLEKMGIEKKNILRKIFKCAEKLSKAEVEVFIGCSGPKIIAGASEIADGILLNYVNPEYVEWARSFMKREIYTAAYGPSLLLPDEKYEMHLLIASAIVLAGANTKFARDFGILDEVKWARNVIESRNFEELKKKKTWLYQKFTISGSEKDVRKIMSKLKVDQVIFGDPMAKNSENIVKLGELLGVNKI